MIDIAPAIKAAVPHISSYDLTLWAQAMAGAMERYGINTERRIAGFVGQSVVETGGFQELVEDMDYSAAGIVRTWPSRFTTLLMAMPYAHNPAKLGNCVYAKRMGNGDEASGDGYLCRGVGLMSTTGRDSLSRFASAVKKPLADAVAWAQTPVGAAEIGCWDWNDMRCSPLADSWSITALSQRINGGNIGLSDRITACNAALSGLTRLQTTAPPKPQPAAVDEADALDDKFNPGV